MVPFLLRMFNVNPESEPLVPAEGRAAPQQHRAPSSPGPCGVLDGASCPSRPCWALTSSAWSLVPEPHLPDPDRPGKPTLPETASPCSPAWPRARALFLLMVGRTGLRAPETTVMHMLVPSLPASRRTLCLDSLQVLQLSLGLTFGWTLPPVLQLCSLAWLLRPQKKTQCKDISFRRCSLPFRGMSVSQVWPSLPFEFWSWLSFLCPLQRLLPIPPERASCL